MCILFIFINPDPKPGEYKVILASNRDEVIGRPAKPAHEWKSHEGCYGGKFYFIGQLLLLSLQLCYFINRNGHAAWKGGWYLAHHQ